MTYPNLTRASIAIAAIVLAARGHAQTDDAQDPVARERARIEAAAGGAARSAVDDELRSFVIEALALGNESEIEKLGAAAEAPLRELCERASLGQLAAFNPNPIRLLAPISAEGAVATLRAAYATDVARFVFLCSVDDGLSRVAFEASKAGRDDTAAGLVALVDEALAGDALTPPQRDAVAVGAVKGGLRSQTIDDAAIAAPDLLADGGEGGARVHAERMRTIDPAYYSDTARALLDVDVEAFYGHATADARSVQLAVLGVAPWTPELRGRTLEAVLTLSRSDHEDVRERALNSLGRRAGELRADDLMPRFDERRARLIDVIDELGNTVPGQELTRALLRCSEGAGRDVLQETARLLLEDADGARMSFIGGWIGAPERPFESVVAVWEVGSRLGERSQAYLVGPVVERIQFAASDEQARLGHEVLAVSPGEKDVWDRVLRFAPPSGLPADLAVRSVRVFTAAGDDGPGELFQAARSWDGVGAGLRALMDDPSEQLRTRLVAAATLLQTDEARAADADSVRALLLSVDGESPLYGALGPFSNGGSEFRTPAAVEARNRAVIDAWNARLDEGRALRFGALTRAISSAPGPLKADALTLARRVLGGPHVGNFFSTNGVTIVTLVDAAAPGEGDGFELVAAAVESERSASSGAFDLALERGFERAAVEGGLRRAASGFLYSGMSGELYSKPFLSRLVGLPAFRADAENALRLSEALAARGDVELMGFAKEALEEIAALKGVAARIANPTDAAAAVAAPDLRATLFEWIAAGRTEGADETAYTVGAIALQTLAELGDPRDRDYFRGLIGSPIYGMDSDAAAVMFKGYLASWSRR